MNYHNVSLSLLQGLIGSQERMSPGRKPGPEKQPTPSPQPFTITISREAGALGYTVATEVGRRLGWAVYDKEILDAIGQEMQRPGAPLAGLDERPSSWLENALATLVRPYHIGSDVYLRYLIATVRGLGLEGRCVIVGRGANFILPAETTLRVRLVASVEDRVRAICARFHLSSVDAAAWLKTTERHRSEFLRQAFRQDGAVPHHYDLMLNTSRLTATETADTIIDVLHRLEAHRVPSDSTPAIVPRTAAGVGTGQS
jgi:hypothetical protein